MEERGRNRTEPFDSMSSAPPLRSRDIQPRHYRSILRLGERVKDRSGGSPMTERGKGFSKLSVINFFNNQGATRPAGIVLEGCIPRSMTDTPFLLGSRLLSSRWTQLPAGSLKDQVSSSLTLEQLFFKRLSPAGIFPRYQSCLGRVSVQLTFRPGSPPRRM